MSSDRVLRFEDPQSWLRAAPGSRACCFQESAAYRRSFGAEKLSRLQLTLTPVQNL